MPNNDNNAWYGILSSENNGLGWMMWENTSFSLSKTLIDRVNPSTKSPTLRILLRNIMLSRAKSPANKIEKILDSIKNPAIKKDEFPYIEKNISFSKYRF